MSNKYFCVLPWYSKEFSSKRTVPCCLLPLNYNLETIRNDLLSGIPTSACKKCWQIESSGKISRRQQENQFLDYKLNRDLEKIFQDCVQNLNQDLVYQITLSNLCNQACTTCNDRASTKWAEIKRQAGLPSQKLQKINLADLNIDYANAKRIEILGGEPLFDPQCEILLSNLLSHGNDTCFVSFVTNGSINLSSRLTDLISAFSDINICVSIDGIQSRFEYMRWPAKWDNLQKNLDQYRTVTKDKISVSYTISAVNAIYYDETVDWFEKQKLNYNHNIVYEPSWASLQTIPLAIKQQLKDHKFFQTHLSMASDHQSSEQFINHLQKQDQIKKISFKDYLPELAAVLTDS